MTDPWGVHEPAALVDATEPLPARLARLVDVQATGVALMSEDPYAGGFPRAEELPEVQSLMREGWRPLHEAPLYCLLPAAWPTQHRTWVPDRRPRVGMGATTGNYFGRVVPREDDDDLVETRTRDALAAGLPAPPTGRIWLLRSPWPRIPVSVIYQIVWSGVERRSGTDGIQQVYRAGCDVLRWDEATALAACPPQTRDLIDAWARAARVGEEAAVVIELRLTPTDLARLTSMTGVDEREALAWLDSLDTDLDDDMIAFISGWRSGGLPGDPPPGASRFTHRDPTELRRWLDVGFDLYAAAKLELNGLPAAIEWRDAGFTEAETYELLRDDPALTPAEAHAFDTPGSAREHRRDWIYFGFSAAEAAAWTATGLTPIEARLWRACAKQPSDVEPGDHLPPELTAQRGSSYLTTFQGGANQYPEWDHLVDPPGTRGRHARRRGGDDDPRILMD